MSDHVTLDVQDAIGTITLNRPEARNALSPEMRQGLAEFTQQLEFDDQVRCVVVRGANGHFMSGGDIKGFKQREQLSPVQRKAGVIRGLGDLHFAIYRLRHMPKPVLTAVQGAAAGAGVSLAAVGDLTIAAQSAFFTLAYSRIGLSPDGSSTYFLPRIIGLKRTFELMYLAERVDAEQAREMGLVNTVVPDADFDQAIDELARKLAQGPTRAYSHGKALLNASFDNTMETQLEREGYAIGDCMMTEDHLEGITAFLEKREPVFRGK